MYGACLAEPINARMGGHAVTVNKTCRGACSDRTMELQHQRLEVFTVDIVLALRMDAYDP